jgi:hypothetical protein
MLNGGVCAMDLNNEITLMKQRCLRIDSILNKCEQSLFGEGSDFDDELVVIDDEMMLKYFEMLSKYQLQSYDFIRRYKAQNPEELEEKSEIKVLASMLMDLEESELRQIRKILMQRKALESNKFSNG